MVIACNSVLVGLGKVSDPKDVGGLEHTTTKPPHRFDCDHVGRVDHHQLQFLMSKSICWGAPLQGIENGVHVYHCITLFWLVRGVRWEDQQVMRRSLRSLSPRT